MAVSTSVSVNDNMSAAFANITMSINACLGAFMDMQQATDESTCKSAVFCKLTVNSRSICSKMKRLLQIYRHLKQLCFVNCLQPF